MQDDMDIRLIEKFLRGKLTEKENLIFEQKKSDPSFLKKMNLHKMSIEAIELGTRDLFKEKLKKEESRIKRKRNNRILTIMSIAAIFILGVLLMKSQLLKPVSHSQEEVLFAHFAPYPVQSVTTPKGIDDLNPREKALSFYSKQDYTNAIEYLQVIPNSVALDTIYLACSFIATKNYEQSISLLNKVSTNVSTINSVLWYKALAYSISNNKSEAISILNKIIASNDPIYHDDALELREILRN